MMSVDFVVAQYVYVWTLEQTMCVYGLPVFTYILIHCTCFCLAWLLVVLFGCVGKRLDFAR